MAVTIPEALRQCLQLQYLLGRYFLNIKVLSIVVVRTIVVSLFRPWFSFVAKHCSYRGWVGLKSGTLTSLLASSFAFNEF